MTAKGIDLAPVLTEMVLWAGKHENTGNQPLSSLELRLPGRRRFHFADPRAEWDKTALTFEPSPDNPRNVQLLTAVEAELARLRATR